MEYLTKIKDWFFSTQIDQQIRDVDYQGLFSNPYFLVPFCLMIGYMIFKKRFIDIVIVVIFIAVWWASGTSYMNSLIVGGEIQIDKLLPVIFGGAAVVGLVMYLIFGRSD